MTVDYFFKIFFLTVHLQAAWETGQEGREGVWEGTGQGQEGEHFTFKSLGELVQLNCLAVHRVLWSQLPTIFFHEEHLWKDISFLSPLFSPFHLYWDLSDKSIKPKTNLKRSRFIWCKSMIEVKYRWKKWLASSQDWFLRFSLKLSNQHLSGALTGLCVMWCLQLACRGWWQSLRVAGWGWPVTLFMPLCEW